MRIVLRVLAVFALVFASAATAKPPPVEHFAKLPSVIDADLSPDGNELALVMENAGSYIVRVISLTGPEAAPRAIGIPDTSRPLWIRWANDEQVILSVQNTEEIDGVPIYTGFLYMMPREMDDSRIIMKPKKKRRSTGVGSRVGSTTGFRQFSNHVIDFLPHDPDHILMGFAGRQGGPGDVYKVNINNDHYTLVRGGEYGIQSWVTDGNQEVRVGRGRNPETARWNITVKGPDGKWSSNDDLPGYDPKHSVLGFTGNPNEMVVRKYGQYDTEGLFVYDLAQKRYSRTLFEHEEFDVAGATYDAGGSEIIGAYFISDSAQQVYFDDRINQHIDVISKNMPGQQLNIYDQTDDGSMVVFKAQTAATPPLMIVYNGREGRLTEVISDYPDLDGMPLASVKTVSYAARDGQEITGYLTLPPKGAGQKNADQPMIILPHGGPYARDSRTFDYLVQFLASRGYGVLQMNFRGSQGYGKKFKEAGRKNWVLMQEDVEDGARWLIDQGYTSAGNMCILGWSYGGYAALMGAVKNSDIYKCAGSIAGVTDLQDLIRDTRRYWMGNFRAKNSIISGFDGTSDLKDNSPVKRASEISMPVFLAHGTADPTVHFDQFTRMEKALASGSAKVTAIELKGGNHSLTDSANRLKMLKELDKFLAKNLGASPYAP